ncbi:hypothetical protein H920_15276 [Fukomys damarensis]|uniref:Uncharacterized protein n=1 Tax=Fukomys damarensis TaxID=885580 RepID=A0A091CZL7_FUKDA|nr:hypothetical protein H920_15276 [Fukomys damarensis]
MFLWHSNLSGLGPCMFYKIEIDAGLLLAFGFGGAVVDSLGSRSNSERVLAEEGASAFYELTQRFATMVQKREEQTEKEAKETGTLARCPLSALRVPTASHGKEMLDKADSKGSERTEADAEKAAFSGMLMSESDPETGYDKGQWGPTTKYD